MKRFIIGFGWLVAACVAVAGTGTSNEFRLDTRTGVRTAAATEKIQYSTAWATNLTAAQHGESKAVVKVNPCLKTPPKYLVVDMSGGRSAARWPISYLDEVPSGGWTDEYKTEKLVLRYIPAGSFIMGGRATDYPGAVNTNLHMVTLTKSFYIGVFECTQRQWELAMGNRPSRFSNEACYAMRPVENVSIREIRGGMLGLTSSRLLLVDDASFMGVVRRKTGLSDLDLASEAQWEFACRAGTMTALNNGKNIPSLGENDALNEVSRNCFNSGWVVDGKQVYVPEDYGGTELLPLDYSVSDEFMTSRVGAYQCNGFGLYDMHGNVWEYILDNVAGQGGLDPIGWSESSDMVGWCGGSFEQAGVAPYVSSRTDFLGRLSSNVEAVERRHRNVGFRICLHNADFPILESVEVLVNAYGASAVDWTPTQAGTYQLTHEVQADGTTVALMESAFFTVVGPELKIVAQGELTNGVLVKVEKVGGGGQWNIYYSLDGSTPTAWSTKYEGPFAIPESATVKAVAISAGGVSSEVASKELALHPALAVEDTKARQRWPWNGKVDIDCEVTGDPAKKYRVSFSVEDEIGHTNLPIRTVGADVLGGPQPHNNENALGDGCGVPGGHALPFLLPPGKYRFTWDAAADLPKGTRFGGVAIEVTGIDMEIRGVSATDALSLNSGIRISWEKNESAVAYRVYRADTPDVMIGETTALTFEDPSLTTSGTYTYYVRGVFGDHEGVPSRSCSAKCLRMSVCADPLVYLPLDGDVKNYGSHPCTFGKYEDDAEWLWLEDRRGEDGRANYLTFAQRIAFPSARAFCVSNTFTVAFWAKTESGLSTIVEERNSGNYGVVGAKYPFVLYPANGGDYGEAGIGIAVGTNGVAVVEHARDWFPATLVYASNVGSSWNHFVVTVADNGAAVLFVNGIKVWEGLVSPKVKKITNTNIGGSADYGKYVGYVDDFMIYGRALSSDEVDTLYHWENPHPVAATYSVKFNANGGTGTMADEVFEIGVAKALTANAFKKDGYAFQGWATSAGGAKVYEDQQSVSDLTTPGATVNLYAVWKELGGVQLWENGPYWAECNVGATKPEESGYYFWWGDTVGYERNSASNGWVSVKDGSSFSFSSGECPTYGKDNSQLQSMGYIDSTGNLVAAHDAATVHLGALWRMPTHAEVSDLINNCDTVWTTQNGVSGRLVKGRGTYSTKSIFFPAAGYGDVSYLRGFGLHGFCWSSTPTSSNPLYAWFLKFNSDDFDEHNSYGIGSCDGLSVRPVRGFDKYNLK